jgi:hypothetical protein
VSELASKVGSSEARVQMRGSRSKSSGSIWSVIERIFRKIVGFFFLGFLIVCVVFFFLHWSLDVVVVADFVDDIVFGTWVWLLLFFVAGDSFFALLCFGFVVFNWLVSCSVDL